MKSYPSSELRNVCDEQNSAVEPAEEGVDLLQQMLDRRSASSFSASMCSFCLSHTESDEFWRLVHVTKPLINVM